MSTGKVVTIVLQMARFTAVVDGLSCLWCGLGSGIVCSVHWVLCAIFADLFVRVQALLSVWVLLEKLIITY
jgi:hypothetical protein